MGASASTPRSGAWSTPTSRCRRTTRTSPRHDQIAAYFESYVDRFGFRDRIELERSVEHVARTVDGWLVTLDGGEERRFDAVVVANGHHWDPRWPEPRFPGRFGGVEMHSHAYLDPEPFRGRRVVVVGMGNSAMDIAVESSEVAARTFLAARRGAWILPKYFFGRPADTLPLAPWIPFEVRRRAVELILAMSVGSPDRYGLPKPDHRLGEAHPTISERILERVRAGAVTPKPNLARLEGDSVVFADGSRERADVIVYCTGYRVSFPFFDADLVSARDNDLPLFRRVFHPELPGLFFVGLLQPLGAIMPLAEAQSEWIADYLTGRYALPAPAALIEDIERERAAMFGRYVASPRHTMQVDFDDYLVDLAAERRRGARRARPCAATPCPSRRARAPRTSRRSRARAGA
ncbi:MAG: NAD(P)-binding domain-containing protein [Sandaracinaceae bacterium]|nr:NAD(P)-binding domain-containing protein [Sandaracinaceae bacterium]